MIDLKTRTAAIAALKEGDDPHEVQRRFHVTYQAIGRWRRMGYLDKYLPAEDPAPRNGTEAPPIPYGPTLLERLTALEQRFDILATHTAQFINLINRIAKEVGITLETK